MSADAHTLLTMICWLFVILCARFRFSWNGPAMPSSASDTASSAMPMPSPPKPSAVARFLPANWNIAMPTVMSATHAYLTHEYRWPEMTTRPTSTGIILHDLASACVGYVTYCSASLDVYMARMYTIDVTATSRVASIGTQRSDPGASACLPRSAPAGWTAPMSTSATSDTTALKTHCTSSTNAVSANSEPSSCFLYNDSWKIPYSR